MNISKVSLPNLQAKRIPQKAAALGAVACGTAFVAQKNKESQETSYKEPKTFFGKWNLAARTINDRLVYFKNKHAIKNSTYKGEMLNPILNNMVANLNADIYNNEQHEIDGFKPIYSVNDKKTGFGAVAYKQDGEIFITYRGTNNASCLKSDWQMAIGKLPEQFELADKFYQDVKNNNPECDITLIGHSLGGSLAQLVASKYNDVPAITLNAFGTDTIRKRNDKQFKDNHNVYNYIIKGDFVSNTSKQVGETVMLDRTYDKNKHDMPNYVDRWA